MRLVWIVVTVVVLALAGCSSMAAATYNATPEPASFDLALVKSHFTDECIRPDFGPDEACQRMDIDGMTADGSTLNIPTALNPSNVDRAREYCRFPASVHYDEKGNDLGYHTIRILDYNGGLLAECWTVSPIP